MHKVTISGYHGMENFGDDFFLDYILSYCRSIGARECFITAREGSLSKTLKENRGLKVTELLPVNRSLKGYDKWLIMLLSALKSESLIFCAGSIFTILPDKLFLFIIKTIKFLKPNIKIIAVGVSIGPFKSSQSEKLICTALGYFDLVIVRDKKSLSYPIKTRVKYLNDLAFTHKPTLNQKTEVIGVALNPYVSIVDKDVFYLELERNDKIAKCLIKNSFNYQCVKIFITCDDSVYGDRRISVDLADKLKKGGLNVQLVTYDGNLKCFEQHFSGVNRLIASRLHAGFFGLLNGAEIFQLKYAEKIEEFYKGLNLNNITFHHAYEFKMDSLNQFLETKAVNYDADYDMLYNLSSKVFAKYKDALNTELL